MIFVDKLRGLLGGDAGSDAGFSVRSAAHDLWVSVSGGMMCWKRCLTRRFGLMFK